ncbi:MAG: SCP2 sterol-binding domain-containing protein [Acidimicrobiales bacterium]
MSAFASAAWASDPTDPVAEAFAAAGGAGRIGRTITGGPDGEVRWTAVVEPGAVTYEPGTVEGADVTFTDTAKAALAQLRGEVDPNASFMRGQTKVTGPTSMLLDVLASARGASFDAARERALARLAG